MTASCALAVAMVASSCRLFWMRALTPRARAVAMAVSSGDQPSLRSCFQQREGLVDCCVCFVESTLAAHGASQLHQCQRAQVPGLRTLECLGQRMEIIHFALSQGSDDIQAPGARQLLGEVIGEIAQQRFGLGARGLRHLLGTLGALRAEPGIHGCRHCEHGQHAADGGDLHRTPQCLAAGLFALALLDKLPLGGLARLAFLAQVAAVTHHAAEHIVRELDTPQVQAFLDAQQASVDQLRQRVGRSAGRVEALAQSLLGDVLAEAGIGEQVVLDDPAHLRWLVGQRALVEIREDLLVRAGEQVK